LVSPRSTPQQEDPIQDGDVYCSDGEEWTEVKNRRSKKIVKIDTPPAEAMKVDAPLRMIDLGGSFLPPPLKYVVEYLGLRRSPLRLTQKERPTRI